MLKNWFLAFFIKKIGASLWNLTALFKARTQARKIHCVLEVNQS